MVEFIFYIYTIIFDIIDSEVGPFFKIFGKIKIKKKSPGGKKFVSESFYYPILAMGT
jgi:hypothetical protein